MLQSCKCCLVQDLVHCFLVYSSILLPFSMLLLLFTQLAHHHDDQIAPSHCFLFNLPLFYKTLSQEEIGITTTWTARNLKGKEKKLNHVSSTY